MSKEMGEKLTLCIQRCGRGVQRSRREGIEGGFSLKVAGCQSWAIKPFVQLCTAIMQHRHAFIYIQKEANIIVNCKLCKLASVWLWNFFEGGSKFVKF